jgi:hypothetical protein
MAKLYQLAEQYRVFNDYVNNALDEDGEEGFDLTEEDIQMYIDTMDSIQDDVANKVENIVKFLKNMEGDIESFKKEEKRIANRRKYMENKHDGLKDYMSNMLQMAGIKSIDAGNFRVKFQKNNPSVEVLNEDHVPAKFREPQPDKILKVEILKALKDKEIIPGVLLVTDKEHLRIK